jgi:hypothetical protein
VGSHSDDLPIPSRRSGLDLNRTFPELTVREEEILMSYLEGLVVKHQLSNKNDSPTYWAIMDGLPRKWKITFQSSLYFSCITLIGLILRLVESLLSST